MYVLQSHCHRWALTVVAVDESIRAGSAVELAAALVDEEAVEVVVSAIVIAVVVTLIIPTVQAIFMSLSAIMMTVVTIVATTVATVVVAEAAILVMIPLLCIATLIGELIRRVSLCGGMRLHIDERKYESSRIKAKGCVALRCYQ